MARIYAIHNKIDGTTLLVKAETKGQVNKYLQSNFSIEMAGSVEVADFMINGAKVVDATSISTVGDAPEGLDELAPSIGSDVPDSVSDIGTDPVQ
jgi:hypothetical protein